MSATQEWWNTDDVVSTVSRHAVAQYMNRAGAKTPTGVTEKLLRWYQGGEEVRRVGRSHIANVARYGTTKARRYGQWILVAQGDTIVTVYPAVKNKWEPVPR